MVEGKIYVSVLVGVASVQEWALLGNFQESLDCLALMNQWSPRGEDRRPVSGQVLQLPAHQIQVLGLNRKHQKTVAFRTSKFGNSESAHQKFKSTEEWKLLGIWSSFCAKLFTETQVWLLFFIDQT